MGRTFISWLAYNKDFKALPNGIQINPKGPTIQIHEHLFSSVETDKHYILQCKPASNKELEKKIRVVSNYILEHYSNHSFEVVYLNIKEDELSNYDLVVAVLRNFLSTVDSSNNLEVITGSGSAIMHMAWVALLYSTDIKFELYLMHHNPDKYPNPIPVPLAKNRLLDQKLKEFNLNKRTPEIIKDSIITKTYERAFTFAKAFESNILILGETGTGKDLLARFIWKNSPLYDKPFEAINCAALPDENLLISELFGHEKDAFTGANRARKGIFQKCNGGTIFMDEIGDMPMKVQQVLLRALENKEVRPLGSDNLVSDVRVRIIAATNIDLWTKCVNNQFRWDLYYRLCDCELELSSFSSRTIAQRRNIIDQSIKQSELRWGRKMIFDYEAKQIFYGHLFPGNFRELTRTINSLMAMELKTIRKSDLPSRFFKKVDEPAKNREISEKRQLEKIYAEQNYNMAATARIWGYSNPHKLKQKMEKMGIQIVNKNI